MSPQLQKFTYNNSRAVLSRIFLLYCVCFMNKNSSAMLIAAYVVPHGGIALDPSQFNTTNSTSKEEAWKIHNSVVEIGHQIDSFNPDVIFLSTPHGMADPENFAFYQNSVGEGFADTDNIKYPDKFKLGVTFDCIFTEAILNELQRDQLNVTGLSAYGPPGIQNDQQFPLRWGEVIPLYFVKTLTKRKVVILSQPSRRYTQSVSMIPELLKLGESLNRILESSEKRIVVIISADLAHTHSKDGPYGFSSAAEPFDKAVGNWVETQDGKSLMVTAAGYVDKALSCGYTGLVMLHGILSSTHSATWNSNLYTNYHPSYYGMMTASFIKNS